jgi:hypothetical protein
MSEEVSQIMIRNTHSGRASFSFFSDGNNSRLLCPYALVDGAFVFTFVLPVVFMDDAEKQMLKECKFDLDIASYSLVKSCVDKHGTTYPDMPWEPKESFHAVADYYAR